MNESLIELLEIILSGDRDKNSFHVRNNFERFHSEFPFLHKTVGVESAVEKILAKSYDQEVINLAIQKIGESEKHKYTRRNYILILADLYLENNDRVGLEEVINTKLLDEFKFHGYRKLLIYYSENYDEKLFLEVFKKIEKKKTLMPVTRNAINLFIEKYSSDNKNIDSIKQFVRKNKIYPQTHYYLTPMLLGYFGNREDFQKLEKIIESEIDDEHDKFFHIETIYNELYRRSDELRYKLKLLSILEDLSRNIPKEIKTKGYPNKLWTLVLWRVGCKYLELDKKTKVEEIIKTLKGKNKISLKELYEEQYANN